MFDAICDLIPFDPDYSQRTRRLDILKRVLDGTIYDVLPYEFHQERNLGGEYIPLRQRRPSVRYPLARIVVDDSLSLVFGEGHFPTLESESPEARAALGVLVRDCALNEVMQEAALKGSIGSVAILLRILRGRIFFCVLETMFLTPEWDPEEPDTLLSVTEKYKVYGKELVDQGYSISDPLAQYWFMRSWDKEDEWWYIPWPIIEQQIPQVDKSKSVKHGLGFVPFVWIRNLPGGNNIDGSCTFRRGIETGIEIDYQLSQAGRGLKYSSDPTLLIKEPFGSDAELIRGGGNALVVSEKGDAKLLEIGGTAAAAVIDYVRTLRELALEGVHGNRANADRLTTAQSGRALEMMNQGLIWLADNLRVSYGNGLLRLARMIVQASNKYPLRAKEGRLSTIPKSAMLSLRWPDWYAASADDKQKNATTLKTLVEAKQMSRETAIKAIADTYHIDDVTAELERIDGEQSGTELE